MPCLTLASPATAIGTFLSSGLEIISTDAK
jgi:hypothetical protein